MKTQELKSYIDRVLGNSIRCLLPSYWWKKLFHSVADRIDEVEQTTSQLIDSKVEEVKMPIVESVDELSKLNLPKGGVASVEKVGEPVVVNLEDCYLSADAATDWDKYTIIRGFGEKGAPSNAVGQIHLYSDKSMENGLTISCGEGKYLYYKIVNGRTYYSSLEEVNEYLASGEYRLVFGYYIENVSAYVTLYSQFPQPSLYIKGDSWDKLAKDYVVASEEELNALSVENGTIAKVVSGGRIVGSFNSLAVGDRVTEVEFMQPPYASGGCLVVFKDKDGNDIGFSVDSNGTECQFGLVTIDVGTIIFGNEKGINQDLYNQAITIFKEKECTFEGVVGEIPVDSFVRPVTKTPVVSNAYIKGETWTRLLKEGDATGLEVRELYIIGNDVVTGNVSEEYTAEQLAYNKETVDLYKQGTVSLVMNATIKTLNLDISCTPINYINTNNGTVICYEVNVVIARVVIWVNVDNTGNAQLFYDDINGDSITVDSELSDTSTNPVQNKVITAALNEKQDKCINLINVGICNTFDELYDKLKDEQISLTIFLTGNIGGRIIINEQCVLMHVTDSYILIHTESASFASYRETQTIAVYDKNSNVWIGDKEHPVYSNWKEINVAALGSYVENSFPSFRVCYMINVENQSQLERKYSIHYPLSIERFPNSQGDFPEYYECVVYVNNTFERWRIYADGDIEKIS